MSPLLLTIFQTIVVLLLAPFTIGCVRFCKARLQGRRGASPFLPYISFATLLRKQMVIAEHVSWVFRIVPFVVLTASVFLVLVLPLLAYGGVLHNYGDLFVVSGVLMIDAIFLVLGGLDAASAFGGMGASREMTITALLEPTIIITFVTFFLATGATTLGGMVGANISILQDPHLVLTLAALALIALAENARYPTDNPATHLELTMVHEAMVLEYSGPYLAMLEYASSVKLTVFALLLSNFLFPASVVTATDPLATILLAIPMTLIKIIVVMGALALIESTIAKMRFYRMQEYLTSAFFLALGGLAVALIQYTL